MNFYYKMILLLPRQPRDSLYVHGVGLGGQEKRVVQRGLAWKLAADSLCRDKPKGLFPHDLVDSTGPALSLCVHGSHMYNLKFSHSHFGNTFESERGLSQVARWVIQVDPGTVLGKPGSGIILP